MAQLRRFPSPFINMGSMSISWRSGPLGGEFYGQALNAICEITELGERGPPHGYGRD